MKVALLSCKLSRNPFIGSCVRPIAEMLPYYQREGDGYVHRVRSANMHYQRLHHGGAYTHTAATFWCGSYGFVYPDGKARRRQKLGVLLAEPSPGRVVCATCEARAIGAGQDGQHKINGKFVKYRPHDAFIPRRKTA